MTNQTAKLLSKEEKIKELSDDAIRDIYSRQIMLKIAEKRRGYIKESSDLFKSLDISKKGHSFYEGIKNLDIQLYLDLKKVEDTTSIEEAIIKKFTKDTSQLEDTKEDIMRYKLTKTSECCGVPKAVLVHNNIEEWADTENL